MEKPESSAEGESAVELEDRDPNSLNQHLQVIAHLREQERAIERNARRGAIILMHRSGSFAKRTVTRAPIAQRFRLFFFPFFSRTRANDLLSNFGALYARRFLLAKFKRALRSLFIVVSSNLMLTFNEVTEDVRSLVRLHIFFVRSGFRLSFSTFILKTLEIINDESVAVTHISSKIISDRFSVTWSKGISS